MKSTKPIKMWERALCGLVVLCLAGFSSGAEIIRPTALDRVPLKWHEHGNIMEFTETQAREWAGAGNQVLKYPAGIGIKNISGENKTLEIIADCGWSRILFIETKWDEDPASNVIRTFGNCGDGQARFRFPVGVEIGGYGDIFAPQYDFVYIVDALNKRVVRLGYDQYESDLLWHDEFGEEILSGPRGIVYLDNNTEERNDDEVLITDMLASKIVRFTAEGDYLGSYGIPGSGVGQLLTPYGICRGPGNMAYQDIYVTDIRNVKICRFRLSENNLLFVNERSFNEDPSGKLMGVTSDDQGILYVADRIKNRLLKFSPELHFIAEVSDETGGSDFAFNKPEVVRFNDGGLVVLNRFSETSGFEFFEEVYTDTLKWDEDWGGMDVDLRSDFLVPCGRTLKFGPGTHISVPPLSDEHNLGIDQDRVEIIVEGTLFSNGLPSDSVLIYSAGTPANRGDWYGIRVKEPCGLVNMGYSSVRNAVSALEFYDGTNNENHIYGIISNSQLEKNSVAGIYATNAILTLAGSLIKENSIYGLYGYKTNGVVDYNHFTNNTSYGIWAHLAGYPADSLKILRNVIDAVPNPASINGLYLSHSMARVEGCKISGYSSSAVRVSAYSPKFRVDSLNCRIGIDCQNNSSPTVRYCRIWQAPLNVGVSATKGSYPNLGQGMADAGNNSIYSSLSSGYRVVNANATTIYAQYNWWGTPNPSPSLFSGPVTYSPWLTGEPPPPPKETAEPATMPTAFSVSNSYPNPFNPVTQIDFSIPTPGDINISVYNIMGQLVKIVQDASLEAGFYRIRWDGTNMHGSQVGSGVYLLSFKYNDSIVTRKVVLLR